MFTQKGGLTDFFVAFLSAVPASATMIGCFLLVLSFTVFVIGLVSVSFRPCMLLILLTSVSVSSRYATILLLMIWISSFRVVV